ncbi:MAG TPA: lipopolysaccharide biosynthesis protein [Caldilineaceae bacterium]|nr:lipopolysaccharide biosynthesis protein [Caldilineaceae bacterium]
MVTAFVRNSIARTSRELRLPLLNSASYLIALQFAVSFFGFFFWAVAARLYPAEEVGIATAVFSMAMLLGSVATLGLPTSLVYFFPRVPDPNRLINACYSVPMLVGLLLAGGFLLGMPYWAPDLLILRGSGFYMLLFLLGTVVIGLSKVQEVLFVAERASKLTFYSGLLVNIAKFPLLFLSLLLVDWSVIFGAIVLASLLGLVVFNAYYQRAIRPGYRPKLVLSPGIWRPLAGYSLGNYLADRISLLPDTIIPLIVLSSLGAASSAHFFMAWAIAGTLNIAGRALGLALFVENSRDGKATRRNVIQSLRFAALLLIPSILGIVFFGRPLLSLLGKEYGEAAGPVLALLAISSIPLTMYRIASSVLKGSSRIKPLVTVTVLSSALNIGLTVALLPVWGLTGAGAARLLASSVTALLITWVAFPTAVRAQISRLRASWPVRRDI